ncbi:hypothetical protein SMB34_06635 [Thalassospira permensis NBRC 106175]|uniref:Transposase n=1 Tax=Thalassospira permensis NBRC 106175 TaxID=1353532 RepID=A0ABR4TN86_9PROT|nr:hypothetical protein SMB34_06635 [Thalassospira permensis NBRC 106175]
MVYPADFKIDFRYSAIAFQVLQSRPHLYRIA